MNGQAAAYSSFRRIQGRCMPDRYAGEPSVPSGDSPRLSGRAQLDCLAPTYFAAACAHFASELRKEFAPGGGSTSPVKAAFEVILWP